MLQVAGATMRSPEFIPPKKKLIVRPKCPACGTLMLLARVEPDGPDQDKRTFECQRCREETTEVVNYR